MKIKNFKTITMKNVCTSSTLLVVNLLLIPTIETYANHIDIC